MKKIDIKIIAILLIIIIICSIILIYKESKKDDYNKELYAQIYKEYEAVFNESEEKTISTAEENTQITYITKNASGVAYRVIASINIPRISVNYPIIAETTEEYLKIAPTKLCGKEPNSVGNFCITGHNFRDDRFFGKLDLLENDDIVKLSDRQGNTVQYKVYDKYIISKNDLTCTNQDTEGKVELTLITCTDNNKNKRLVVKCTKIN